MLDDLVCVTARDGVGVDRETAELVGPKVPANLTLLDDEGEDLVREQVERERWRFDRFDVSGAPKVHEAGGLQQGKPVTGGQEQHVPSGSGPAARSTETLKEGRDR